MDKKTQILLGVGALALVVGYFVYKNNKQPKVFVDDKRNKKVIIY